MRERAIRNYPEAFREPTVLANGFQAVTSQNNSGSFSVVQFEFTPAAVPEPTSLTLAGIGALSGLGFDLWRRRRLG